MSNLSLPIVFIHKGNSWYLPYTLWQVHQTNPQQPIYFIGDASTKHFPRWVRHVEISKYNCSTSHLDSVYRHNSRLGPEFEQTCIQRWFILDAFMDDYGFDRCVYLDSDILVYEDLAKVYQKLPGHQMTWCGFSAHSNFISNHSALKLYCQNVIDLYTGCFPAEYIEQSLFHRVMANKVSGNISDMTFFYDFNLRYPGSLLLVSDPNPEGTFDVSMEETRVFENNGSGFKKIYWKGKQPWGKVTKTGVMVPFVTLHFQGKGKQILKKHFNTGDLSFYCMNLGNATRILISRVVRRISNCFGR